MSLLWSLKTHIQYLYLFIIPFQGPLVMKYHLFFNESSRVCDDAATSWPPLCVLPETSRGSACLWLDTRRRSWPAFSPWATAAATTTTALPPNPCSPAAERPPHPRTTHACVFFLHAGRTFFHGRQQIDVNWKKKKRKKPLGGNSMPSFCALKITTRQIWSATARRHEKKQKASGLTKPTIWFDGFFKDESHKRKRDSERTFFLMKGNQTGRQAWRKVIKK